MASTGHFISTSLMELEIALTAVEAIEQQSPTAFTECQREKGLPCELV